MFSLSQRLHTELADSAVNIQETFLLKLLQFAGIKDKCQLWGEKNTAEQESSGDNLPAFLTSARYYFEKLQVGAFQVVVTGNPASKLPDELQSLKTTLEIPAGFPPLMENANIKFGNLKNSFFLVYVYIIAHYNQRLGIAFDDLDSGQALSPLPSW